MGKIKNAFSGDGAIWLWLILTMSIMAMGVAIERFIFIFFKYNINAQAFMGQIQKLVMADQIDRAIKLCNAAPSAALARVVKAGLTNANKGEIEIQNAIEEASLEVVPLLTRRLPMLQQLANLATLLGLLGTIIGLIESFEALENAPQDKKQEMLAGGIALAMNTTAAGLIAALPALFIHLFLSAVSRKIVEDIDQYSVKVSNLLSSRVTSGGAR
jgi:biopolymer transport protein ExbB/TolQ